MITERHLDNLGKMMLVTGWIVIYSYIIEDFIAWYSGSPYEMYQFFVARPFGRERRRLLGAACSATSSCRSFLWSKSRPRQPRLRSSSVSIFVNVGMWAERFVIIVMSLQRDFLPVRGTATRPPSSISTSRRHVRAFHFAVSGVLAADSFHPLSEVKEMRHHEARGEHP